MAKATSWEYRSIFENTTALFFFACHHNETHIDFEESFRRCVRVELGLSKSRKLTAFQSVSTAEDFTTIKDVMRQFKELGLSLPGQTFCERKTSTWQQKHLSPDKKSVVSPKPFLTPFPFDNINQAMSRKAVLVDLGRDTNDSV